MTEKKDYAGGGHRDSEEGKVDFTLLFPKGIPYAEQPIVKLAAYLTEKAEHYGSRNWEKFHTQEPRDHTERSMFRHVVKDVCEEADEPHDLAAMSNLLFKIAMDWKIKNGWTPNDSAPDVVVEIDGDVDEKTFRQTVEGTLRGKAAADRIWGRRKVDRSLPPNSAVSGPSEEF